MIKIEKEFKGKGEVSGINFTQIKREGLLCIYKRSDSYYEVIKLVERKAATGNFGGVIVEFKERETYPKGDSWNGKCVNSLERAEEIFKTQLEL